MLSKFVGPSDQALSAYFLIGESEVGSFIHYGVFAVSYKRRLLKLFFSLCSLPVHVKTFRLHAKVGTRRFTFLVLLHRCCFTAQLLECHTFAAQKVFAKPTKQGWAVPRISCSFHM